jgi:DHA1 family inner membrane transport protein
MSLSLLALAISAFAIGMTEFVVIGILPILAAAFHISIANAGNLVTWYALSVVVGAPLGAAFTARMPRKTLLVSLMVLFVIGNLLSALAPGHGQLVLGRIFSGIAHGIFFAVSTNVAVQIVPKEKQAHAIALMFSGLTLALVAGVPLGTFLATGFSGDLRSML